MEQCEHFKHARRLEATYGPRGSGGSLRHRAPFATPSAARFSATARALRYCPMSSLIGAGGTSALCCEMLSSAHTRLRHGHEISLGIKGLCARTVKSSPIRQKSATNVYPRPYYPFMEAESELDRRMARDNEAVEELRKLLDAYQGDRTPENRTAYLQALRAFSKQAHLSALRHRFQSIGVQHDSEVGAVAVGTPD